MPREAAGLQERWDAPAASCAAAEESCTWLSQQLKDKTKVSQLEHRLGTEKHALLHK